MKKAISVILAAAFALSGALALTACKDDGAPVEQNKVSSAEEWAAAMDFSDVTNGTIVISGIDGQVIKYYMDGDKDKTVREKLDGSDRKTQYNEYKPNEPYPGREDRGTVYEYRYNKDTSAWTVSAEAIYDRDSLYEYFKDGIDDNLCTYDEQTGKYTGKLSQRYADFTYDDGKDAYVASFDKLDYTTNVKVEIKFKNGKLSQGTMSATENMDGETTEINITFEISDLGATVVQLPAVSK